MVGGFKHVLFSIICWDTPSHRLSYIFQDGFCTTNLLFFFCTPWYPQNFSWSKIPENQQLSHSNCDFVPCGTKIPFPPWTNRAVPVIQNIYHLVMTNSSPWKIHPFLIGKPSISMDHCGTEVRLGPDHRPLRGHGPRCRLHLVGSCRLADGDSGSNAGDRIGFIYIGYILYIHYI